MAIDLYSQWLQVPAGKRPPDHFALLGLRPDVDDEAAIEEAARRQVERVKDHLDGPHADSGAKLLQEIARARAVLLDPARRTAYRAALKAAPGGGDPWWKSEVRSPARADKAPTAPARPAAAPAPAAAFAGIGSDMRPQRSRGLPTALLFLLGGAALIALAGGIIAAVIIFATPAGPTERAGGAAPTTTALPPATTPVVNDGGNGNNTAAPPNPPIRSSFLAEAEAVAGEAPRFTEGKTFIRHTGLVQSLAISPRQRRFLSAGGGGVIEWDLASGRSFLRHDFRTPASAVAYLPDGRRAVAADEGTILLIDLASNDVKATLKYPRGNLQCLAVDPDGNHVLTGGNDGSVLWWDLAGGRVEKTIEVGDSITLSSVALSGDRRFVAIGGNDGSVGVWELASGKRAWREKQQQAAAVTALAFSADSKRLASGALDGPIALWDAESGKRLARLAGHAEGTLCMAFMKNGAGLASGGRDKALKFWNLDSLQLLRSLDMPAPVHALAVAVNESYLLAAGGSGLLQLVPVPELDFSAIVLEQPPEKKLARPPLTEIAEATAALRDKHKNELNAAKPEELQVVAERWLARAGSKVEPAQRWALFEAAIDTLIKLGRPEPALKAILQMDRWFEIDELTESAQAVSGLARSTAPPAQKDVVEAGLKLLQQADAAARPDLAGPLLAALTQAAQKSGAPDLVKRVAAVAREREQAAQVRGRQAELEAKLKADPADPAVNLEYGLLLCGRNRWADGLGHVAKGGDEALARLAQKDLADPKEARAKAELGQAWADAAGKARDSKALFLTRAKHWLEEAQAGLSGEDKSRAILRLGDITAQLSALKPAAEKEPAGGVKPSAGPKPAEAVRRNFNTLKNETVYKSQWTATGAARPEGNGLRFLDGDASLESKFLLVDNWRVEIILEPDSRTATVTVNSQEIPLRVGGRPGILIIERKGKKLVYQRSISSNRMGQPTILDLTEVNQTPSRLTIRISGMNRPNFDPDGALLLGIVVSGPVRMEEPEKDKPDKGKPPEKDR